MNIHITRRLVLAASIGMAAMNMAWACSPPMGQQPPSPQQRADSKQHLADRLLHAPEPAYAHVFYGRVLTDPVRGRSEIAVQRWFRGGLGETQLRAIILVTSCGRFPTVGDELVFAGQDYDNLLAFYDGNLSDNAALYQLLLQRAGRP